MDAEELRELEQDAARHKEEDDEGRKAHVAVDQLHALHADAEVPW